MTTLYKLNRVNPLIYLFSGTCYIGNRNSATLLGLVLIPHFIYFLFGIFLLILGCVRAIRKPRPSAAAPLTAATPRKESDFLGAVCTLYAIPTFCVMASIYYEYTNRDQWLNRESKPALWAFLLRHLMSLFIGVSTIFWIWSMKTITAWRAVLRRLGPRKQLPVKVQTMPVLRYVPAHPSTLSTTSRHSTRSHPHRKPRVHHIRTGGETVIWYEEGKISRILGVKELALFKSWFCIYSVICEGAGCL